MTPEDVQEIKSRLSIMRYDDWVTQTGHGMIQRVNVCLCWDGEIFSKMVLDKPEAPRRLNIGEGFRP